MAEIKTQPTDTDVYAWLNEIPEPEKRADALAICDLFAKVVGSPPVLWGTDIVGFGDCHLKYQSGRELDWFISGFAPRKANFALYLTSGLDDEVQEILKRIGKYKTSKYCIYITSLKKCNIDVLEELIQLSVDRLKAGQFPGCRGCESIDLES